MLLALNIRPLTNNPFRDEPNFRAEFLDNSAGGTHNDSSDVFGKYLVENFPRTHRPGFEHSPSSRKRNRPCNRQTLYDEERRGSGTLVGKSRLEMRPSGCVVQRVGTYRYLNICDHTTHTNDNRRRRRPPPPAKKRKKTRDHHPLKTSFEEYPRIMGDKTG